MKVEDVIEKAYLECKAEYGDLAAPFNFATAIAQALRDAGMVEPRQSFIEWDEYHEMIHDQPDVRCEICYMENKIRKHEPNFNRNYAPEEGGKLDQ